MASALQFESRVVRQDGEFQRRIAREFRRGGADIGQSKGSRRRLHAGKRVRQQSAEARVYGFFLALDLRLEHLQAVAHGHDCARLDEQGRAAGARCVHDAGEALVGVAPHGQHPPPFSFGDEAVLDHARIAGKELFHAREHSLARGMPLASQVAQAGAGSVRERSVRVEAAIDFVAQPVQRRIGGAGFEQRGKPGPASREKAAQHAGRSEHPPDAAKLDGGQRPTHPRALDRVADLVDLADRKRAAFLQ